jgi:signal transduction histidine kinase
MRLAGLLTVGAVALSFGVEPDPHLGLRWLVIAVYIACFLGFQPSPTRLREGLLALELVAALWLLWLVPRAGTVPVLLVVAIAQAATVWRPAVVLAIAAIANLAMYLLLREAGFRQPLLIVIIYGGFQAFAALTAHYARSVEVARDALVRVNADLLATRALLADSARDAERLRLARELHDVAGHKLTAMRLQLRRLAADPALRQREEVLAAEQLSAELLGDLRNVVQSMRDDRGLDLATALQALASPFPRPRLRLHIDPQVRIVDPLMAEAVLRIAQEALTNAARHGDAEHVDITLAREDDQLRIDIEDDGRRAERIREGNGIAGMRERLAALHGKLELGRGTRGGMHLIARLPA